MTHWYTQLDYERAHAMPRKAKLFNGCDERQLFWIWEGLQLLQDKRLAEGDSLVDLRLISDLKQAALRERINRPGALRK